MAEMACEREQGGSAPYWLAAIAVAVALHIVVPLLLVLPPPSFISAGTEPSATVMEVTFPSEAELSGASQTTAPAKAQPAQPLARAVAIPEPPPPPAKVKEDKAPQAAAETSPKTAVERTEFALPETPLDAFDSSKSTADAPEKAYASDRTSTAADHGPKNLPRGDPYLDKGQSNIVRALGDRGEGNLPAVPSEANSGSVKKEGSPDAGKGPETSAQIAKKPVERVPLAAGSSAASAEKPTPLAANSAASATPEKRAPLAAGSSAASAEKPTPLAANSAASATPEKRAPLAAGSSAASAEKPTPLAANSAASATQSEPARTATELDAFKILLENAAHGPAPGNAAGEKAGVTGRPGAKGHEGDGTLRPGDDEAVSDVTTFNINSSAAESDEARFAKHRDPVSTYFRPLFRRIDNKWKAEIVARDRLRPVIGEVLMKIVVRKDGKLLEATELSRTPKDLPDELVSIAKIAVERAAAPLSEPFSMELADKEKLETKIGFIY